MSSTDWARSLATRAARSASPIRARIRIADSPGAWPKLGLAALSMPWNVIELRKRASFWSWVMPGVSRNRPWRSITACMFSRVVRRCSMFCKVCAALEPAPPSSWAETVGVSIWIAAAAS